MNESINRYPFLSHNKGGILNSVWYTTSYIKKFGIEIKIITSRPRNGTNYDKKSEDVSIPFNKCY